MRSIVQLALTYSFVAPNHHCFGGFFVRNIYNRVLIPRVVEAAATTCGSSSRTSNYYRNFQHCSGRLWMSSSTTNNNEMPNDPSSMYTTNEEDQREAAALQERLKNSSAKRRTANELHPSLPSVEIAEGAHKYVLIKAHYDGEEQYIVTSRKGAHYHRNAAEPMIMKLEEAGYYDIEVTGGGRIALDSHKKTCHIYGFSYSFGLANHAISQQLVKADPRYKDYDITISDSGY